jgi:hypothetical protein
VATFFISFYILAIFVFINLFIAVLLEAFEREFDDSIELDLTPEHLVDFKNDWDGKCEELLAQELVKPRRGFCGMTSTSKSMPVRYLRDFIQALRPESAVGECKEIGDRVVWWNRLLYELSIQERCSLFEVEPLVIHEAEQGQSDASYLDRIIEFDEVVRACNLMRNAASADEGVDSLTILTYGERMELQAKLDAAREDCAMELLRASVGAWRKLRYPPEDVAQRIADDPTGNEKKIWTMQVRHIVDDAPHASVSLSLSVCARAVLRCCALLGCPGLTAACPVSCVLCPVWCPLLCVRARCVVSAGYTIGGYGPDIDDGHHHPEDQDRIDKNNKQTQTKESDIDHHQSQLKSGGGVRNKDRARGGAAARRIVKTGNDNFLCHSRLPSCQLY